jgi:hypothetical protein
MKANELRIGNLIRFKDDKDTIELTEENFSNLILFKTLHRLEPIPLTKEWLLKFGFEKNGNYLLEIKDNGAFFYDLNDKEFWVGGYDSCVSSQGFIISNIEFVHQLQNLYFVLTNNEL